MGVGQLYPFRFLSYNLVGVVYKYLQQFAETFTLTNMKNPAREAGEKVIMYACKSLNCL